MKFNNVYFFNGTAYAGKSTMVKRLDTLFSLTYHYYDNYERTTLMLVLVTGTTYVTTKTMLTKTAHGLIGVY